MTWNPHEIVTLDDQPEDNELCRCGHSRSPHHELGVGKCDLVADGRPCQCSRYQQQSRYEDGEGYELGRAYGSPKPVDYVSPFCNCKHPESWHAEGTGLCEYPGSNRTEGCGCEAFDRVKFPQETHCAACEDAAKWPGGWDAKNEETPICPNCGRLLGMCTCKPDPRYIAKPMRIRYMELPGEINPNTNELTTPFVIVFDRVTGGPLDLETGNAIALNTGARGVLAFEQEIQIGEDD